MKLPRKISVILCLAVILAVMLPQSAFAIGQVSVEDGNGNYQSYGLFAMGGAEPASDASLRVYWGDFSTTGQGYRIMWSAEGSRQWQSVEIDDPQPASYKNVKSYLITGLAPDQKYDIKISTILKNQRGKCYTGNVKTQGYTYLTAPKYEPYSCSSTGEYIESIWNVKERNAVLKIYRADSKDGEYRLVSTMDGTENANAEYRKYDKGKIVFRDTDVKPTASYYYKAVSELTMDDGTIVRKESVSACKLTAKNKAYRDVKLSGRLLNQRSAYAKTLTFKLSSGSANYNITLLKSKMAVHSIRSSDGKPYSIRPARIQYSFDGKNYTTLKSAVSLKPGKTIYLRIMLKSKMWLRKDGAGNLEIGTKYRYKVSKDNAYVNRQLVMTMDNQVEFYDAYEGDGWDDDWDSTYDGFYMGMPSQLGLSAIASADSQSVVLDWRLHVLADEFSVQYGTSEEEAAGSKPVVLSKGQFAYQIDGLMADTQYYFIVTMKYKDTDGQVKELNETISLKTAA